MKISEIKNMKNNELIREYVFKHSMLYVNICLQRSIKRLSKQCIELERELVKRGLLKPRDIELLHM